MGPLELEDPVGSHEGIRNGALEVGSMAVTNTVPGWCHRSQSSYIASVHSEQTEDSPASKYNPIQIIKDGIQSTCMPSIGVACRESLWPISKTRAQDHQAQGGHGPTGITVDPFCFSVIG